MAVVTVAHHPELTAEDAMELFRTHFAGKYEVYEARPTTPGITPAGRDFIVKKSGWTAVGVALRHEPNATVFLFTPFMPSTLFYLPFHLLLAGWIVRLPLRPSWKAMEKEVGSFIENAPEFK